MRQEMTDTSSRFHQRRAQFVLKESNLIKFDQQCIKLHRSINIQILLFFFFEKKNETMNR